MVIRVGRAKDIHQGQRRLAVIHVRILTDAESIHRLTEADERQRHQVCNASKAGWRNLGGNCTNGINDRRNPLLVFVEPNIKRSAWTEQGTKRPESSQRIGSVMQNAGGMNDVETLWRKRWMLQVSLNEMHTRRIGSRMELSIGISLFKS